MAKTQAEWMAEALAEMKKATWTPKKSYTATQQGYPPGTPYDWASTHNYYAASALWNAAHPPVEPVPPGPIPPTPGGITGQRCVYMSGVTQHAIDRLADLSRGVPPGWYTVLFSADLNESAPGKPYYVTDAQIKQLSNAGATVASWCDGTATPISAAKKLAERGMSFASGQYETVPQWNAMKDIVPLGIGNPAEFLGKPEYNELAAYKGKLIGEMLHPQPNYSAQGINISSVCVYVDMDAAQGGYQPLVSFDGIPAGFKRSASLYTGGRATDSDIALYGEWTKP